MDKMTKDEWKFFEKECWIGPIAPNLDEGKLLHSIILKLEQLKP